MSEKTKYPRGKYPRTRREGKTVSLWMPAEFPLSPIESREILLNLIQHDQYMAKGKRKDFMALNEKFKEAYKKLFDTYKVDVP